MDRGVYRVRGCLPSEENITELAKCIRSNLDCADSCETTARVLARHTVRRRPSRHARHAAHSVGGVVALLVITTFSVVKPQGLTGCGWRKQQERRRK
ncbi:hypothetical protein ACIHFD_41825 [Nonomuraea sp. NPDC051941]|uniref:hypothetical protein n=1 Tax=Nonomuraea sp. NPDC051941 TaxID=3364373 RepID=UPI0037C88F5C